MDNPDYLILGTGLSALSFGALMAKSGKSVKLLEAHEYPGGYGHTFPQGDKYRFNAQLHYVWNCGEGQPVYQILKKLGLHEEVTFEKYNPEGYDRMRIPGFALDIPYDYDLLGDRLAEMFPKSDNNIRSFLNTIQLIGDGITRIDSAKDPIQLAKNIRPLWNLTRYHKATLQQVFDSFNLPLEAQSLLASQWPDFLLPPEHLSIVAWTALFTGYGRGAFYPTRHYEHVVNSLTKVILDNGGEIKYETKVIDFILANNSIRGVIADGISAKCDQNEYLAKNVVCNFDPRRAAEMIGTDKLSKRTNKRLDYDYSPSSFMVYCTVEGIDLHELGFGNSNLFHSSETDINKSFYKMNVLGDYSKPSFAVTTPSLHTSVQGCCPEGQHVIEFLTVANYQHFLDLRLNSRRGYNKRKDEICNTIIDVAEEHYIPNLRDHIVFKITGSPTTSERYCGAPMGNAYGSSLTPRNLGLSRLDHRTSLRNFYFCNASSGYAGFAGTFRTGARLYEKLTGDPVYERNGA
ncbi:MAG: NAD(P)/FAD-dependent oxidoreductase [Candidatus Hydrogenedentota bacterium]